MIRRNKDVGRNNDGGVLLLFALVSPILMAVSAEARTIKLPMERPIIDSKKAVADQLA